MHRLVDRNCKGCDKIYSAVVSELKRGKGKYCSLQCYFQSERKIDKKIKCLTCNAEIHITKSNLENRKFCNKECFHKYPALKFNKDCIYCKGKIPYRVGGNKRRYCCISCASLHAAKLKRAKKYKREY